MDWPVTSYRLAMGSAFSVLPLKQSLKSLSYARIRTSTVNCIMEYNQRFMEGIDLEKKKYCYSVQ
jgi:hypothetical protein